MGFIPHVIMIGLSLLYGLIMGREFKYCDKLLAFESNYYAISDNFLLAYGMSKEETIAELKRSNKERGDISAKKPTDQWINIIYVLKCISHVSFCFTAGYLNTIIYRCLKDSNYVSMWYLFGLGIIMYLLLKLDFYLDTVYIELSSHYILKKRLKFFKSINRIH